MQSICRHFTDPIAHGRELSIHALGVQEPMRPGHVHRPGGTGDYLLMFFYQPARIGSDDAAPWHDAHRLMVWEPGRGHFYGNPDRRWWHSWLHCDGRFIRRQLKKYRIPCNRPIALVDASAVERALLAVLEEITGHAASDRRIVQNHLDTWLRQIRRDRRPRPTDDAVPPALLHTKRYIEAHYADRLTLNELARHAHLAPTYFCAQFKHHFGATPIDYVVRLRLHRAAYLLRNQNLRIGDIARAVGYSDVYHFSKLFKKNYGLSPRDMRRQQCRGLE